MTNECLYCNSGGLIPVRTYRTNSLKGKEVFNGAALQECTNCRLVQAVPKPQPHSLEQYYKADYRGKGYAGSDVADVGRFPYDNLYYCNRGESITELLKSYVTNPAPEILDIGAGYGHILYFLGRQFPQSSRFAVEFSEACIQHLQSQKINVFSEPAELVLSDMPEKFDVVTLSHVLEHLLDPKEILRLIHSSLKKDGLLYIEVPNIPRDSLLRFPDHMWAPRFDEPHITFFSVTTLKNLVEAAGFRMEFCSTAGPFYKHVSALRYRMPPFRESIVKWMPKSLFRFLRSRNFTKAVRVHEREESFFQYGGFRLWIRSVWRKV